MPVTNAVCTNAALVSIAICSLKIGARKLKCHGEPAGCSRCLAERATCHYSPRKTMGRPRKRQREKEDHIQASDDEVGGFGAMDYRAIASPLVYMGLGDLSPNGTGASDSQRAGVGEDGPRLQPTEHDGGLFDFQSSTDFDTQFLDLPSFSPTTRFPPWDAAQNAHSFVSEETTNQAPLPSSQTSKGGANSNAPLNNIQSGCSCLGSLYSTLATFQSLPAPSFPYSMGTFRRAITCGYQVVRCETCPQGYNMAVQNSMLLGTLLQMLINEYAKLLKYVDERATNGTKIAFRIGEISSCLDQRHTGTPDCPMAINVDLNGDEWRMLARNAIRQDVLGSTEDNDCLLSIVQEMRARQVVWHEKFSRQNDLHDATVINESEAQPLSGKGDFECRQVSHIDHLKRLLEALKL